MEYVIVATYIAKTEAAEEVAGRLRTMAAKTNEEPGCRSYEVYRSREDAAVFVLVEVYEDEEAFKTHAAADYFQENIVGAVWPLLENRTVVRGAPLG
jgi:quinol monooxygenase YgiN